MRTEQNIQSLTAHLGQESLKTYRICSPKGKTGVKKGLSLLAHSSPSLTVLSLAFMRTVCTGGEGGIVIAPPHHYGKSCLAETPGQLNAPLRNAEGLAGLLNY